MSHPSLPLQLLVDKYIIRKPISSIPSMYVVPESLSIMVPFGLTCDPFRLRWQSAMGNILSYVIPSNRSSEVTNAWWNYNSNWTAVLAMDEYMKVRK